MSAAVAAVPCKPLILLVRRFSAAVLRRLAAVTRKVLISNNAAVCGGWCGAHPHTPYALRGAMLARTAGAFPLGRRYVRYRTGGCYMASRPARPSGGDCGYANNAVLGVVLAQQ
jgi:hypothetical protein